MQSDMEEAKGQELIKLHNSLEAIQTKVDKTHALLTKEREAAQENIDKLSTKVEELKRLLELEKNRANESEKKWSEALETSESKRQKLEETVSNANQLQESINRLEEKLTNIESENQVLHRKLIMAQDTRLHATRSWSIRYDKQQECQDLLIRCISRHLGFSKGRPVAACIIYKCLRQWRSFEVEKTSIFDRIIQTIGQAIQTQDNNEILAYWLSNASTLLVLLQHTLEQDKINCAGLLFKQQLTAYVGKIFGMIRDNLKKEISPLLKLCIDQAPRDFGPEFLNKTDASPDILIANWQGILNNFDCFLNILKSNNVSPYLVRKFFTQIFSFINTHIFNSLVVRRECCCFSNGEYVKAGLSKLEYWCFKATEEYAGSAWDELKRTRQVVGFLVMQQKPKKTLDEIRQDVCPLLSIWQLYRISTLYWDDNNGTHSLSPDVCIY